ncbi:nucleotide sugar dehydrogenase [Microlunatus soli]|uniref:Nucleotide sugar dehydrogenase n=1 Tax=Microlunatus soli TaxID=630515 RepID=A0A1H2ANN4_9ACTN|nr:nucleotide sugar dehydrogenase [Microlunatus soli]SDT47437.1 nucleotide sugar dehydrogenase [Microlunatus soli]
MSKVAIVGQGYVGLPLARTAINAGLEVVGVDADADIVAGLNNGHSHVDDLSAADLAAMVSNGYRATSDAAELRHAEYVIICVPTPLSEDGDPDLGPLRAAAADVARQLSAGTLVVVESTTYPGTTDEVVRPILEESGLIAGQDFNLAYSPERIDPGNPEFGLQNTPKIVGGHTQACGERAAIFYGKLVQDVVRVRGTREAEMAKLLENTYRHINIALVNDMVRLSRELGLDLWEAIGAAATKPFGYQPFWPGPGVGGHCIPIDPRYLSHEASVRLGHPLRFVELAREVNESMPGYVAERIEERLDADGIPLAGATVLLLGITYKPDIGDSRETPAAPLARILRDGGAIVQYHDPFIGEWELDADQLTSVADLASSVAGADLCVLLQQHRDYDLDDIATRAARVLDTRGVMTGESVERL